MITDSPYLAREVSFVVPGEPATKSRARVTIRGGKVHAYTPDKTVAAEAAMAAEFLRQVGRLAPSKTHAFGVSATFYMASGIRRDVDNMLKIVLDGLNKIAWGDDYQVTKIEGQKVAVPKGEERTEVRIYTAGVLIEREAKCAHCGATYPRPPSHAAKKYCSADCRREAIAARRRRACKHCGDTFTPGRDIGAADYCSAPCAYKAKHVEVSCIHCGAGFTKARSLVRRGNHYCSDECKAAYWREHRKATT